MAWKNTEKHIQNEQVHREELQPDTLRNIKLPPEQDIKAITGKAKDKGGVEQHCGHDKKHACTVLPCAIAEKITENPSGYAA